MARDDVFNALIGIGLAYLAYKKFAAPDSAPGTPSQPDTSNVVGSISWQEPRTGTGEGIREVGQGANCTISVTGLTPGAPYKIQNRNRETGEIVAESGEVLVPSEGRILIETNEPIPAPYTPGRYQVVLIYGGLVFLLSPGFEIRNTIPHDMNSVDLYIEPPIDPDTVDEYLLRRGIYL